MNSRPCHIALVFILALALSCSGPKKISREDMAAIFHDIFLEEQLIRQDITLRRTADTSLVYEGIFQAHGYDTDDFLYSLEYYVSEPERLAKIMDKVESTLSEEAGDIKEMIRFGDWKDRLMRIYYYSPDTTLLPQVPPPSSDSLYMGFHRDSLTFINGNGGL